MELSLLASMVVADGALSQIRSPYFDTFTGFDPPRFDLFRHISLVQSVCDLRYAIIICYYDASGQTERAGHHVSFLTSKTQAMRAILLASATATSLGWQRCSNCSTQGLPPDWPALRRRWM